MKNFNLFSTILVVGILSNGCSGPENYGGANSNAQKIRVLRIISLLMTQVLALEALKLIEQALVMQQQEQAQVLAVLGQFYSLCKNELD